jgi:hypothetical protein
MAAFVKNIWTGEIRLLAHDGGDFPATEWVDGHYLGGVSLSGNGRYAAFTSSAKNLVPSDWNDYNDVFLADTGFDLPPNPCAGGPYLLPEGQALVLDATCTTNPTGYPLTFTWDVNGDGIFGDATGMTPTLSWSQLNALGISNGPSSFQVRVRVDDGHGHVVDSAPVALTVHNVAPTLSNLSLDRTSIDEGDTVTLAGVVTDPGVGETFTLTVTWGDGKTDTLTLPFTTATAGQPFSLSHVYEDNPDGVDSLPISVSLSDGDGGTTTASLAVEVHNVAPVLSNLTLSAAQLVEGGTVILSGLFTDPGAAENFTLLITWGDGTTDTLPLPYTEARNGRAFSLQHQYLDDPAGSDDQYPISVQVTDGDGGTATGKLAVDVSNAAPVLTMLRLSATQINEDGTVTLTGTVTDPGVGELFTLTVTWGDGSSATLILPYSQARQGQPFSLQHTYLDDPPGEQEQYGVAVQLTDDDGGSATGHLAVLVRNVAPTLTSLHLNALDIVEGQGIALSGAFVDSGRNEAFTLQVFWGDGSSNTLAWSATDATAGLPFILTHTYGDDGISSGGSHLYPIQVRLQDDDGGSTTGSVAVTVHNLAPTLTGLAVSPNHIGEGQQVTLSGSFTDPGLTWPSESFRLEVDWGDGTAVESWAVSGGTFGGFTHTYVQQPPGGSATITATLYDDDGGFASGTAPVQVERVPPVLQSFRTTAGVDVLQHGLRWHPVSFAVSFTGAATVQFDWDGDGSFEVQAAGPATGRLAVSYTYDRAGTYTPKVRLVDAAGTFSPTLGMAGGPVAITADPVMFLDGALVVAGTPGNDVIRVTTTKANAVTVRLGTAAPVRNPAGGTSFNVTGSRVIVYGGPGNDQLSVVGSGTLPVELHGGEDNDTLRGGAGADLLWGDHGDDQLWGNAGRDLLIGGLGRDTLHGGAEHDVLLGGLVDAPFDAGRLRALAASWGRSPRDTGTVAAALAALVQATWDPDGPADLDRLYGEAGQDFLLYRRTGLAADWADFLASADARRTF